MDHYQRSSWDHRGSGSPWMPQSPSLHGGWLESAAKGIYFLMALTLLVSWGVKRERSQPRVPEMPYAQEMAAIAQANDAANEFLSKRNAWTDDDLINVRNRLIMIRDQPGATMLVKDHTVMLLKQTVTDTLDGLRMQFGRDLTPGILRAQDLELKLGRAIPNDGNHTPISGREVRHGLWKIAKVIFTFYALFIPFAFVCLLARLSAYKRSLVDELAFGWRRFLNAGIFWFVGLAYYPGDSSKELRHKRILYEYLARTGKHHAKLAPEDYALINALVLAPKTELNNRLNAIRELSWGAFMRMRMAFYASIVTGYLLAPFSFARAQSLSTSDAVPAQPAAEVHGFGQLDTSVPSGSSTLTRFLLMGSFHPADRVDGTIFLNLAPTPTLLFAEMSWHPWGGPIGFRAGQMGLRPAYMVPRPDKGRLMDGPLAERFIQFISPGAEVFGDHGSFAWALACVAGSGPNQPDNNRAKDVVASAQFKRWKPMLLEAAVQAGQQPEGFRTMASAHLALHLGKLDLDALGVRDRTEGANTGQGVSSMAAVRASSHVDLALGHDWLAPADQPPSHTVRGQVTFLAVRDLLRLGLHSFWNSVTGFGGTLRLQYGF